MKGAVGREITRTRGVFGKGVERGKYDIGLFRRIQGEDSFDLLIIDRDRSIFKPKEWYQAGVSREEYNRAMREYIENLEIVDAGFLPTSKAFYEPAYYEGKLPHGVPPKPSPETPRIVIGEAETISDEEYVSRMVHEFTHALHWSTASRITGKPLAYFGDQTKWPAQTPNLEDILSFVLFNDPELQKRLTEKGLLKAGQVVKKGQRLGKLRYELDQLVLKEVQEQYGYTLEKAKEQIAKSKWGTTGKKYFQTDHEMLAFSMQQILRDPEGAMKTAPFASRVLLWWIRREAPEVRHLMSRQGGVLADIWDDLFRFFEGSGASVWELGTPQMTKAGLKEFNRTGWGPGLRALVGGKDYEYVARMAGDRTKVYVRNLDTGKEELVEASEMMRPLLSETVAFTDDVVKALDELVQTRPTRFPLNIVDLIPVPGEKARMGLRRAMVDTSEFAHLKNQTIGEWLESLPTEIREKLTAKFGQLKIPTLMSANGYTSKEAEAAARYLDEILEITGHKGILKDDNGYIEIFVSDLDTLVKSPVIESLGFGAKEAGIFGTAQSRTFQVHLDEWLKQSLREKGVREPDIPYFLKIARRRLGDQLDKIMEKEAQVTKKVEPPKKKKKKGKGKKEKGQGPIALQDADDAIDLANLESAANRIGVDIEPLADGRLLLRDRRSKTIYGKVREEDEALDYLNDLGVDDGTQDIADFPGAVNHGGAGKPPKLGDPEVPHPASDLPKEEPGKIMGFVKKLVDAHHLAAPIATALENFAKKAESAGLGPAYTKVYLPAHNAMLDVMRELSVIPREQLGGETYRDMLTKISHAMVFVRRKRYRIVTGHVEARTRQEIEQAGGLMGRAMTEAELKASKFLQSVGLENDVPRLMSLRRLIIGAEKGRLLTVIGEMERMQLSPEAEQVLNVFRTMPKMTKREDIYKFLGTTEEEKRVIKMIEDSFKQKKDEFSIMAVSRHASAPELKKGFKNGQDQFAFENNMTAAELKTSALVKQTLEAVFLDSGLDPKRHLSGYWPHMRVWVANGFVPKEIPLPPEVLDWAAMRFRTGEMNVYDVDPLSAVYRHMRGLFMKKHFDPKLKDIHKTLRAMQRQDSRTARVMNEYISELMGHPHASFDKVQGAISRTWFMLTGKRPSERIANDVVSGLSALASAAVIPFRPALILRNYAESLLKVTPRVGAEYYFRALKYVTDPKTKKQAFSEALASGAIRPATQRIRSLHSAEELFGPTAPGLLHKYLQVFDIGFGWYQSADDWGRAIAHHSQRMRLEDNLDDLIKGRIDEWAFMQRSKITTYDVLDQEIAMNHIRNGDFKKATDHLGQVFSRESMVRYGYADHPVGWNSVQGRLFGQFGTWPVQYKDYLAQALTRGTTKDKAEFLAYHAGVSAAIVGAGAAIGVNLTSWTGQGMYTGGPYTDLTIDLMKALSGSEPEKALARSNLYGQIPIYGWLTTGNPRSVLLPGSYLMGDLMSGYEAMQNQDVFHGVMRGAGIRILRPEEQPPLHWLQDLF